MSVQKIVAAIALCTAASSTFAQGFGYGKWTHMLDMGIAAAYVDVHQPCPAGAQYGFKALYLAPHSNEPAFDKHGLAPACIDFSVINRRSTHFWIYVPGSAVGEVVTGVGENLNGYPFEFKAFTTPGPAVEHLTPVMLHAMAEAAHNKAESAKRHAAYLAQEADKARRQGL